MIDIKFHGGDADSGNVFGVETIASAGLVLESHVHKHGHLSVLVSGTADVTIGGKTQRLTGYNVVTIPSNTAHKVQSVTDMVWLCLWADDLVDEQQAIDSLRLITHG